MNQIRENSGKTMSEITGNFGKATLPGFLGTRGSKFFERDPRCFYFSPESQALFYLSYF